MKFDIPVQKLRDTISLIERVAGKHITLPVLSCIHIEASKSSVIFKTTNLDMGIEVEIPLKVETPGIVAIPAHIISSFIAQSSQQSDVAKLELIQGNLAVSTKKSKVLIKSVPAEDFPSIPKISDGQSFTIEPELLVKGLQSVWYSSSVSTVKPELSSVYVYKNVDNLVFVATDSFRLAECKIKIPSTTSFEEILIPFKNVNNLINVLERMNGPITVTSNKNLISIASGEIYAVSRLIDGSFPDYKQIIPKSSTTEVVVLTQDFLNALKISNIFADKFNLVKIIADPKAKLFEVQTKNSDIGENKTVVDASVTGDRAEINFNYKYIIDCFQSLNSDSMSLSIGGLNKPMIIRPISGDQSFMYLVMPMNR